MRDYAVVLSNDISDADRMLDVCRASAPYVDGVKIGITSSMLPGVDIFRRVREAVGEDTTILADYKVADIGFQGGDGNWSGTNEKIVRNLSEAGADYITCHTFPGISSIQESIETAHKLGSKILTLPYMTHKGAAMFFGLPLDRAAKEHLKREFEAYGLLQKGNADSVELLADLGRSKTLSDAILALGEYFGVDGYIGPGNEPSILDGYREFTEAEVWSPGFGRQDRQGRDLETQVMDWAQIVGPHSAMIVGSLIYKASDPAAAAREVMETRDRVTQKLNTP